MTELFDLGGIVAVVVAAYQSSLLQALLNGYGTPAMYAEELGLDAMATERVLDVLAQVGVAECERGRYAASADLKQLDAWQLGGLDALGALWSQVPAFLSRGERLAHMDGSLAIREAAFSGSSHSWPKPSETGHDSSLRGFQGGRRTFWMSERVRASGALRWPSITRERE